MCRKTPTFATNTSANVLTSGYCSSYRFLRLLLRISCPLNSAVSITSRHLRRSSGNWPGAIAASAAALLFLNFRSTLPPGPEPEPVVYVVPAETLREEGATAACSSSPPMSDCRPSDCVDARGSACRGGAGSEWCERDGNGTIPFAPAPLLVLVERADAGTRVAVELYGERGCGCLDGGIPRPSVAVNGLPMRSMPSSSSSELSDSASMSRRPGVSGRGVVRKRDAIGRCSIDSRGESTRGGRPPTPT
jgi:hypothetical protein